MGYSLGIATDGYLSGCGKTLPIVTDGYLNNCVAVIPVTPGGGAAAPGAGKGLTLRERLIESKKRELLDLKERQLIDEHELLTFIKAFMRCLD